MRAVKAWLLTVLLVTAWIPWARIQAQATANALAVAEDAFGSTEGSESIGIYDATSVRGFSLESAGNYRINGRYFVKNSGVSSYFVEKTIVRIGHNALWLDYPGPSGVVDYRLRDPRRDEPSLVTVGLDSYEQPLTELHFKHRSEDDSVAASIGLGKGFKTEDEQGGEGRDWLLAGTLRKTLGSARLQVFAGEYRYDRMGRFRISLSSDATTLPAEIERGRYLGQSWATEEGARRIVGGLADIGLDGGWSLSGLGVFGEEAPDSKFTQLFSDLGADAHARNLVILSPEQRSHSYSGELRLGKGFETGAFTHAAALNARFRASRSRFGGERIVEGDSVRLGERPAALAYPDLGDAEGPDRSGELWGHLSGEPARSIQGWWRHSLFGLLEAIHQRAGRRYLQQLRTVAV
jgi:iron complex outermembrane recepter protein